MQYYTSVPLYNSVQMLKLLLFIAVLAVAATAERQFRPQPRNDAPFEKSNRQEFQEFFGNKENEINNFDRRQRQPKNSNGFQDEKLNEEFPRGNDRDEYGNRRPNRRPSKKFSRESDSDESAESRSYRFREPNQRENRPNYERFPPNHGHRPYRPLPPLFANVTKEDLKTFFSIMRDRNLTKEERDTKLRDWAEAQGTEFAVSYHIKISFEIHNEIYLIFMSELYTRKNNLFILGKI